MLGGGLLLLLVCLADVARPARGAATSAPRRSAQPHEPKTLMRALSLIFIADISTSLDNVLAVAGVARGQPAWVLFVGLALSVALTGFAAAGVAKLLHRWPWIGYIGLVVVLFVAGRMVWDGAHQMGWVRSRRAPAALPRASGESRLFERTRTRQAVTDDREPDTRDALTAAARASRAS